MIKNLLLLIGFATLSTPNVIQADVAKIASNTYNFVQNHPYASLVGTMLSINALKSGKKSIPAYGLQAGLATIKFIPKLCSTKALLAISATTLGTYGTYLAYKKYKDEQDNELIF